MVLVATVVPWVNRNTFESGMSSSRVARRTASITACEGSSGVDGTFNVKTSPVSSLMITRSVKVPPTSTPMRIPPSIRPIAPNQGAIELDDRTLINQIDVSYIDYSMNQ